MTVILILKVKSKYFGARIQNNQILIIGHFGALFSFENKTSIYSIGGIYPQNPLQSQFVHKITKTTFVIDKSSQTIYQYQEGSNRVTCQYTSEQPYLQTQQTRKFYQMTGSRIFPVSYGHCTIDEKSNLYIFHGFSPSENETTDHVYKVSNLVQQKENSQAHVTLFPGLTALKYLCGEDLEKVKNYDLRQNFDQACPGPRMGHKVFSIGSGRIMMIGNFTFL